MSLALCGVLIFTLILGFALHNLIKYLIRLRMYQLTSMWLMYVTLVCLLALKIAYFSVLCTTDFRHEIVMVLGNLSQCLFLFVGVLLTHNVQDVIAMLHELMRGTP